MYELKDKIKLAFSHLKKEVSGEEPPDTKRSMVLISTLEDAFEIALERNRELTSLFDRLNGMSLPFNDQSFKNSDSDRITKLEKEVYSLKKSID